MRRNRGTTQPLNLSPKGIRTPLLGGKADQAPIPKHLIFINQLEETRVLR